MHHPGPPRFLHVGESIELAPRSPDVSGTYAWRVVDKPDGSTVTVEDGEERSSSGSQTQSGDRAEQSSASSRAKPGDSAVVHFTPDVPGVYRVELTAPDGTHTQTIRAFPDQRREARFSVAAEDVDIDRAAVDHVAVIGQFNDFTMGTHRAEWRGDEWVLDTMLPPGTHEAIFAFNDEFDPHATSEITVEGAGRPRVRLDGQCEGSDVVITATAQAAPDGSDPSVEFYLDDRTSLTASDVVIQDDTLRVPLDSLSELTRIHAVPVAEQHGIADTLVLCPEAGGNLSFERPADPPAWVESATIYEIFVRTFAGTAETTFEAIERRVPYLESLGIDVVWFTPVCESPTKHGYHITDLFETASDLGTRDEFVSLIDRLHESDIKVIFDLVINHTSRDHPAFHLHRADVPEYADHYERIPTTQDTTEIEWAGDDAPGHYFTWTRIPNVNYDSLAVREWMLDVIDHWAPLVDGFRCDVAWGVPHGFWKEVRERMKARDPDFVLLDETVPRDAAFRENEFDLHYDTDLYSTLRDIGTGEKPATAVFDALCASQRHGYPDEANHMRYIENHDEERYATACETGSLRPAVAATFTLPGVPMIYSGQERGVPEQRGPMRWYDGDADLTAFHRRLIELRSEQPALRGTGVEPVECNTETGDSDRVAAYERTSQNETRIVVLNFGATPVTVALDRSIEPVNLLDRTDVSCDAGVRIDDVGVFRTR